MKRAITWTLLAAAALCWLACARRDATGSIDPVALTLLPPASRVEALVESDGTLHPITGTTAEWTVDGGVVSFRRGTRLAHIDLERLARDPAGRPRLETLRFPLGTDRLGRDLAARVARGGLVSLGIGLGGVLLAGLFGALAALLAAFGGRAADALLVASGDLLLAVPRILLVMALAAVLRPGAIGLALLLGVTGWPPIARVLRAAVRTLAASDFVAAARAAGASTPRVMVRHVLPHLGGPLAVALALRVGPYLLLEASLSFLGFGVAPPSPSWGNILADARDVLTEAPWMVIAPGIALALTVLVANVVADRVAGAGRARPATIVTAPRAAAAS